MRVVCVVDSIADLNQKINFLKMKFGENISYIVRADFEDIFKTYGYQINATYYKNLTKVVHNFLINCNIDDIVIYYTSLKIDLTLLNNFVNSIGNKQKIVSVMPKYNALEKFCNSAYNVYVNSMFKVKDGLVSAKLQFIPADIVVELLSTHMGNRLFEVPHEINKTISTDNVEINKSLKTKVNSIKNTLIGIIVALIITMGLLASIAYLKSNFIAILICVFAYILNFMLSIIFIFKKKFDLRFLK